MATKEQKIKCPKCGESISIDDVLTHQIEEKIKKDIAAELMAKEIEIAETKRNLESQKLELENEKKAVQIEINKKVADKLNTEKLNLWKQAQAEAKKEKEAEKKLLEEQLAEKDAKLQDAQERELEIRKEKNKLEEDKKSFELKMQRQLDEERNKIQENTLKKLEEEHRLKDAEKDKKLQDALRMNDELKRKLQQGSQQTQGEVLELELEELIKVNFPLDQIDPVPKGVNGADVVQRVVNTSGHPCGTIVWESKHTKAWSDGWVQKLKDDQRLVKGDIAILVSEVLPKGLKNFGQVNGIWITSPQCAQSLAFALRSQLVEIAITKLSAVGKNEKMELLYRYLSGSEFKQRVEAIVEAFVEMQTDIQEEKRVAERRWSKREKQILRVINNTSGMYGDFQGLIGSSLQTIPALEAGFSSESDEVSVANKTEEVDPEEIPF